MHYYYIFLDLFSRNGEYEYNHLSVHRLELGKNELEFAREYASSFYMKDEDEENDERDGGFYFNCGEVYVRIDRVEIITQKEYKILLKFL